MQTALRWAAVLPAAAGAFFGTIVLTWAAARSAVLGSPYLDAMSGVGGWAMAGPAAIMAGVSVAPDHKRIIGAVIAVAVVVSLVAAVFTMEIGTLGLIYIGTGVVTTVISGVVAMATPAMEET